MSHTYRFEKDEHEDPRAVRRMKSEYNKREDARIEAMLRRQSQVEERVS